MHAYARLKWGSAGWKFRMPVHSCKGGKQVKKTRLLGELRGQVHRGDVLAENRNAASLESGGVPVHF